MPSQHHQTLPRSMWVLLVLLTFGWGVNWPMMKLTLAELPVWTFRGLCVGSGAAGLFLIARLGGQSLRVPRGQWTRLIVTSACNVTLWNVFIGYGLTMLPAGRSAILAYSMPVWAVLLSLFILHEKLTRRRLLGLVLGMAGMALLIGGEFTVMRASPLGAILVVGAAFGWALGTVLMKRHPMGLGTTALTAWQLLIGGLPIMIGALIIDWGRWRPIGTPAVIGLVYNMFFVFIFCYWAWFKIATTAPPSVSSLSTLMIPIVGVFSGIWLLGESPRWQEYAALVLVIAALATVLIPPRRTAPV
ncbi:MAG: DMT family transporter [Betaproteobacteria bacterium]|nr:DMT family transporter [Betaproteobacteria bacterium]